MGTLISIEGVAILALIASAFLVGDWTWPGSTLHFDADDFISGLPTGFVVGLLLSIVLGILSTSLLPVAIAILGVIPLLYGLRIKRDEDVIGGIVRCESNIPNWGEEWQWNLSLSTSGHKGWEVEPGSIKVSPDGVSGVIFHGTSRVSVSAHRSGRETYSGGSRLRVDYFATHLHGEDRLFNQFRKRLQFKGLF